MSVIGSNAAYLCEICGATLNQNMSDNYRIDGRFYCEVHYEEQVLLANQGAVEEIHE